MSLMSAGSISLDSAFKQDNNHINVYSQKAFSLLNFILFYA